MPNWSAGFHTNLLTFTDAHGRYSARDLPAGRYQVKASANSFLPTLDKMIGGGLVTLEKVKVVHYRGAEKK